MSFSEKHLFEENVLMNPQVAYKNFFRDPTFDPFILCCTFLDNSLTFPRAPLFFLRTDKSVKRDFILPNTPLPFPSGKSLVSEPENEVQASEVGGGGLRVSAEEERIASHKQVETGD